MQNTNPVILETKHCVLSVGADCIAESLTFKDNGKEGLMPDADTAPAKGSLIRAFENAQIVE